MIAWLVAAAALGAKPLGADPSTWSPQAPENQARLGEDPATWAPALLGDDPKTWAPAAKAESNSNSTRRQLASAGCNACCFQNDCSLAFSQSQPGVCCGAHRTRGQIGCCPMGASCVPCANICK